VPKRQAPAEASACEGTRLFASILSGKAHLGEAQVLGLAKEWS